MMNNEPSFSSSFAVRSSSDPKPETRTIRIILVFLLRKGNGIYSTGIYVRYPYLVSAIIEENSNETIFSSYSCELTIYCFYNRV